MSGPQAHLPRKEFILWLKKIGLSLSAVDPRRASCKSPCQSSKRLPVPWIRVILCCHLRASTTEKPLSKFTGRLSIPLWPWFLDIPSEDEQNQPSDRCFQPKKCENIWNVSSLRICVAMGEPLAEPNSLTGWGIFNPPYEWGVCPVPHAVQIGLPVRSRMMIEVENPFNLLFRGSGGLDPV